VPGGGTSSGTICAVHSLPDVGTALPATLPGFGHLGGELSDLRQWVRIHKRIGREARSCPTSSISSGVAKSLSQTFREGIARRACSVRKATRSVAHGRSRSVTSGPADGITGRSQTGTQTGTGEATAKPHGGTFPAVLDATLDRLRDRTGGGSERRCG
jgi:hypothetical protein